MNEQTTEKLVKLNPAAGAFGALFGAAFAGPTGALIGAASGATLFGSSNNSPSAITISQDAYRGLSLMALIALGVSQMGNGGNRWGG